MLPSECLQQARDLITPPGTWTQEVGARNKSGKSVPPGSAAAVSFCSTGACDRISDGYNAMWYLHEACGGSVIVFNDAPGRTQDEVLAAFDKAIALAKSEGR